MYLANLWASLASRMLIVCVSMVLHAPHAGHDVDRLAVRLALADIIGKLRAVEIGRIHEILGPRALILGQPLATARRGENVIAQNVVHDFSPLVSSART